MDNRCEKCVHYVQNSKECCAYISIIDRSCVPVAFLQDCDCFISFKAREGLRKAFYDHYHINAENTDETEEKETPDDKVKFLRLLVNAVRKAEEDGKPFLMTSHVAGLYARRDELPMPLDEFSRRKLLKLANIALKRGDLVYVKTKLEEDSRTMAYLSIPQVEN